MAKPKYNVPDGFKRCSHGDNCVHPMGCIQPADSEHFGTDKRASDGWKSACRLCCNADLRRYYSKYPEKRSEYDRRFYMSHSLEIRQRTSNYYRLNRDAMLHWQHEYRLIHAERYRVTKKLYREAHKAEARKYNSDWRIRNHDRLKKSSSQYYLRNLTSSRVRRARRRARRRELPDTLSSSDWLRALGYFGGCCAICGQATSERVTLAADHWIPLSDPRPDNPGTVPTNIVPLCHGRGGCNNRKFNRNPLEFLQTEFGAERAAEILARIEAYFAWVKSQADQS